MASGDPMYAPRCTSEVASACVAQMGRVSGELQERAGRREQGEAAFVAELSRDDLSRYASSTSESVELGAHVCRFLYAGQAAEVTDELTASGFDNGDAALFVGAADATICAD